jgi:hypothetical protein
LPWPATAAMVVRAVAPAMALPRAVVLPIAAVPRLAVVVPAVGIIASTGIIVVAVVAPALRPLAKLRLVRLRLALLRLVPPAVLVPLRLPPAVLVKLLPRLRLRPALPPPPVPSTALSAVFVTSAFGAKPIRPAPLAGLLLRVEACPEPSARQSDFSKPDLPCGVRLLFFDVPFSTWITASP